MLSGDAFTWEIYPELIAALMACSGKDTLNAMYDEKWQRYMAWCDTEGSDSLVPNGPRLAHSFDHLFLEKGLAYSTLGL
jgi:hypothetical protein